MHLRIFVLLGALALAVTLAAQPAGGLRVLVAPGDAPVVDRLLRGFKPQAIRPADSVLVFPARDSAELVVMAQNLLERLRDAAYLSASLDDFLLIDSATARARLHLGPEMRWVKLRVQPGEADGWLSDAGFREKLFTDRPLRYDALLRLERALLEQAENDGYPFATVRLDSVVIAPDGGVTATLRVERQRFFSLKALKIIGDLRLPAGFLPNYLGLRPGAPYQRAKLLLARDRLRSLPFLEATGDPTVTFAGETATVNLFLRKKRAGRFDFLIGLLPRTDAAENESRLLLTGSLNAAFQNALNLGERLSIEIERLRPETQKLDAQAAVPYVFGLPFGVEGRLSIFRRDSTWVDAQSQLGVQYLFEGGDFVSFFWENKSSNLQKIDTLSVLSTRRLPPNLDLRQNGFGIATALNRLDYRFNPRRGWALGLRTVAGFNTVRRNPTIESLRDPGDPAFTFSSLYDSVAGRVARFRLEGQAEYFIPLFARATLKLGARGGGIFSARPVFANEQYRLGGNKLMRGFDEESLFATRFVVGTVELRLLLSQNSYLAAFSDYGYLENITNRGGSFLRPWGVGAGLNFETPLGIFGLNVAFGRQDLGQAIAWRAAKFHLGYVSLF